MSSAAVSPPSQNPPAVESNQAAAVLLCTSGYDRTVRFWEALSGICSRTLQHPDSHVNRLALSADKRFLAVAGNPHVRIYEALGNNGNPIASLEGHKANVTSLAFQYAAQWLVSGSEDGKIKLWDLRTKGVQREYVHKHPVNDVIVHPNQGELISCDQNGSIKIWDLAANQCTHELVPEDDVPMRSVSLAADGSLLVAGNNKGNVYIWKMLVNQHHAQPPAVDLKALSPINNSESASTAPRRVNDENSSDMVNKKSTSDGLLWDLQPVSKIQAHSQYLLRALLSPDGRRIATASADSTIKLWNLNASSDISGGGTVQLEKTLMGHTRWVWDCAFSADSEYLVSVSSDHTARLWDLSSGETIRQYQGHHKAAVCVALNDYSLA